MPRPGAWCRSARRYLVFVLHPLGQYIGQRGSKTHGKCLGTRSPKGKRMHPLTWVSLAGSDPSVTSRLGTVFLPETITLPQAHLARQPSTVRTPCACALAGLVSTARTACQVSKGRIGSHWTSAVSISSS
jgi:hypothetical protein